MSYTLKVDHPELGKGQELMIPGLGIFKNGTTHTIDDETVEQYDGVYGATIPSDNADGGDDVVLGFTERMANMYGVEVTYKASAPRGKKKSEEEDNQNEGGES